MHVVATLAFIPLLLAQQPSVPHAPAAVTPPAEAMHAPDRTMVDDAVLLTQQRRVPGSAEFVAQHEGFEYRFASKESRDAFIAEPWRYAAADGGACGRMGPLGGLGDARRYALQGGRLYFFASDDCMRTFQAQPHLYIEAADVVPVGTLQAQADGMAAIDRWIAWSGGADRVRAVARYQQVGVRTVVQSGQPWELTESIELQWPRTAHEVAAWRKLQPTEAETASGAANLRYEVVTTPTMAALTSSIGPPLALADSRRKAFERQVARLPISILHARFSPEAGLLAVKTGEGIVGSAACDFVATHFDGATTYLAIEKDSGRLAQMGYRGRDTDARMKPLTLDIIAYADAQALRLPTQWITSETGATEGDRSPLVQISVAGAEPAGDAHQPPGAAGAAGAASPSARDRQ